MKSILAAVCLAVLATIAAAHQPALAQSTRGMTVPLALASGAAGENVRFLFELTPEDAGTSCTVDADLVVRFPESGSKPVIRPLSLSNSFGFSIEDYAFTPAAGGRRQAISASLWIRDSSWATGGTCSLAGTWETFDMVTGQTISRGPHPGVCMGIMYFISPFGGVLCLATTDGEDSDGSAVPPPTTYSPQLQRSSPHGM